VEEEEEEKEAHTASRAPTPARVRRDSRDINISACAKDCRDRSRFVHANV